MVILRQALSSQSENGKIGRKSILSQAPLTKCSYFNRTINLEAVIRTVQIPIKVSQTILYQLLMT